MKSFTRLSQLTLATVFMAATALSVPTAFADGWAEPGGSIKDAPVAYGYNWSGLYIGGHAGLATGDTEGSVPGTGGLFDTDFDFDGGIYGGHVGYNIQSGAAVFGIEGTFSGSSVDGNTSCVFGFLTCERELDWLATIEGRLGYAFGRSLLYARGGVAWGKLETDVSFANFTIFQGDDTHVGWTAGFGFEHAFSDNIIARIEYSHVDLGSETTNLSTPFGGTIPDSIEAELDTIRIGVSYKFGGPGL